MPTKLKADFQKDPDGCCTNCGRTAPPCRCGETYPRKCSIHPNVPMRILAIPVYRGTQIKWWVDIAECSVMGCTLAHSIKNGQNVPRNQNRKGKPA